MEVCLLLCLLLRAVLFMHGGACVKGGRVSAERGEHNRVQHGFKTSEPVWFKIGCACHDGLWLKVVVTTSGGGYV